MSTDKSKSDKKDNVLERAKQRFKLASEADENIRKEARDDYKFRAGDQWPEDIRYQRQLQKRPCLTVNQLPMFLRQIINDQRQNRPSIKINAVSDDATMETAEVLEGLIRNIEYQSNAEIAYDTATDAQCTGGFGFFRIGTEYCNPESFDQDIRILPIKDPFTVRLDPFSSKPDGSDATYAFVFEDISKDSFKEQWPKSELSQMDDWTSLGDTAKDWVNQDGCRVADYYEKTFKEKKIFQLNSGEVIFEDQMPKVLPEGVEIVSERETRVPIVTHYKINGEEILEQSLFPSSYIPIIPVLGGELFVDGKRILEGVIRHAKDSQRGYNYWVTASAEMIALAPKAPFVGVEGQFEGYERQWKTANTENHAFLQYKDVPLSNGNVAPPPQRQIYEPPTQALTQERGLAQQDLRSTTGIMDSALGQRSNENSGLAIQRRNQQSQISNFHFADNFSRSLKHAGRIILEMIPKIYDTERTLRIIHEDGEQESVAVNQALGRDPQTGEDIPGHYFDTGEYDVTVSSGPSYQTKRQEAAASMIEMAKAYPPLMQVAGDILVQNMDWPKHQEVAERMKKMLPPNLQDDNNDEIPPQVKNQLQQQTLVIQQLAGKLAAAQHMIDTKMIETSSKERTSLAKIKADIEIALAEMGSAHAETLLEHDVARIQRDEDRSHALEQREFEQSQNPSGGANPGQNASGGASPAQNLGSNP